jgi:hypothetical protein
VRYSVDHGGAKLKMADCGFLPLVDRAGMPTLQQVVVTDGAHDGLPGFHDGFAAGADHFIPVPAKPEDPLLRSAGRPIPGAQLRVVDPATLQHLPDGQTGEVPIESPGKLVGGAVAGHAQRLGRQRPQAAVARLAVLGHDLGAFQRGGAFAGQAAASNISTAMPRMINSFASKSTAAQSGARARA